MEKEFNEGNLDENGQPSIDKLTEDQKMLIGYRIPTEYKYSMIPMKIVGFLPKIAGDAIMMPKEITAQTGSDFDVDKIFLMRKSDGKSEVDKIDNEIFDLFYQFLTYPSALKQTIKPQNYDAWSKKSKEYGKKHEDFFKNIDKNYIGVADEDIKHSTFCAAYPQSFMKYHRQNTIAKKMIGIFASNNGSHAFTSLVPDVARTAQFSDSQLFILYDLDIISNRNEIYVDNEKALDGTHITEEIGQALSVAVDGSKKPILGN